jgi:hypothetical protein
LALRVARHLAALRALLSSDAELEPDKAVEIDSLPDAAEVQARGAGAFLHPPN